ncbi:hypothetical protein AAX29_01017 [Aliarcobacter thereius]|uniref:UDP-4-amino-4, 6-dideoxy-N-acetyl-beta-L-altrosamine N-acetyltransferase n=1 Tax=Aliarcobacter thereius TaxID=544718 RepID=A0A1C0B8N3_9BACT|nr:hypothetical protein [Aliarcobacter thereius]OCL99964.1 hypothetical protein AAX29_01017 [Aliarcobacter thereius]TLS73356.1 hypothetical protein FE246_02375 [Aliarcobacter thereius]HJE02881.1 hypothetical protein [Aliarcobacter thereius]
MKLVFKNFIFLNDIKKKDILELRNKEYVRENMINNEPISLENHILFIESLKENKNKTYFAIFFDNQLIGSLNIIKNEELTWGLYFKEEANPIIKSCATYLFLDFIFSKFNEDINSFVKRKNIQALNFNKNFGFEVFKEDEEYYYLKLSKELWKDKKDSKIIKPIKRYLDKIEYYFE